MTQALDSIIAAQQCSEALGSRIKVVTCSSSTTANCLLAVEASGLLQIAVKVLPLYSVILHEDVLQQSSSRPLKKKMLNPKWKQQVFMCWTTGVTPHMRGTCSHVAQLLFEANIWSNNVAQKCHFLSLSIDYIQSWAAYCTHVYLCSLCQCYTLICETNSSVTS